MWKSRNKQKRQYSSNLDCSRLIAAFLTIQPQLLGPAAFEEAYEEDAATEGELDGHGRPYTAQSELRGEAGGKRQSYGPHREEAHHGRHDGVAGTDKHAVADDGSGEHRFCPSLDAQHLGAQGDDLLDRRHDRHQLRGEGPHQHTHHRHHADAQSDRHTGKAPRQHPLSGPDALSHEGGGSFGDAVARHVAETLHGDAQRVGSDGDGAQGSHDEGAHDLS